GDESARHLDAFKAHLYGLGAQNNPAALRSSLESAYTALESKFSGVLRPNPGVSSGPVESDAEDTIGAPNMPDQPMHVDKEDWGQAVASVAGLSESHKRELFPAVRAQGKKA
ncbi:unnamed protein product, partial [Prorocentrum cordatum]